MLLAVNRGGRLGLRLVPSFSPAALFTPCLAGGATAGGVDPDDAFSSIPCEHSAARTAQMRAMPHPCVLLCAPDMHHFMPPPVCCADEKGFAFIHYLQVSHPCERIAALACMDRHPGCQQSPMAARSPAPRIGAPACQ